MTESGCLLVLLVGLIRPSSKKFDVVSKKKKINHMTNDLKLLFNCTLWLHHISFLLVILLEWSPIFPKPGLRSNINVPPAIQKGIFTTDKGESSSDYSRLFVEGSKLSSMCIPNLGKHHRNTHKHLHYSNNTIWNNIFLSREHTQKKSTVQIVN